MPSLQPGGLYRYPRAPAGFALFTIKSFVLEVDQKVSLTIPLSLTSAGETIEVGGSAPLIESGTVTVGESARQSGGPGDSS